MNKYKFKLSKFLNSKIKRIPQVSTFTKRLLFQTSWKKNTLIVQVNFRKATNYHKTIFFFSILLKNNPQTIKTNKHFTFPLSRNPDHRYFPHMQPRTCV